ncbi:MAG: hypothetical protein EOR67_12675 [Mesorhizobium sp.]|uniref:hypothetical protein n=2 Tax=Mesorhizobium sp. TaxID=1871066 RepID=UPI000FE876BB|nr:hypothetical protein [Mesorhizobium sp.]RWL84312.1 MAG: hypothetical protein EOR69_08835 [Mesorhizobium sp.]RWL88792.1 MAG: hypothetical protein EOR67_12675 [Mesorhizobium sp.]RWM03333.1 MAG: hypothetical protein EOR70_03160 [Mesorhizobium sp.]TJV72793.1 MAG: hypothetical protein E5X76_09365 [Mesorhizobium sp.]
MRLPPVFGIMDDLRSHRIQLDLERLLQTRRRAERLVGETGSAIARSRILLRQSRLLLAKIGRDRSLDPPWRNAQGARPEARSQK